jgi:hypothetical protein
MEEIYAFLLSDQTNKQKYDEKAYNCVNFTAIFKKNAEAKGLKAGTVFMTYKDPQGNETKHQMICFRTEDAGLVLVEPQTDAVIPAALKEQYFFPRVVMTLYCQ